MSVVARTGWLVSALFSLGLACSHKGAEPPAPTVGPATSGAPPTASTQVAPPPPPPVAPQATVEGVVLSSYACPPCPDGAMCKPCVGDHVMLGDSPSTPAEQQRRVFVTDPGRYAVGQRVRFSAEVVGPPERREYRALREEPAP